jgi:threonine dehydratase
MTLEIMHSLLDDVLLVGEEDLRHGVREILEHTHNLAEGAGAAAYAAVRKNASRFHGQTVVAVLSGGNLDLTRLPWVLAGETGAG